MNDRLRVAGLTTFGLGFMRPAPGTWGSLPPCGVAWLCALAAAPAGLTHALLVVILLVFSAACVVWGAWGEKRFGRKDASEIVADETAGQCIPLMFLPAFALDGFWAASFTIGGAFVLFRIMDIIKPWPAHGLQRLRHGWGVLVDDLIAGLYAAIVLQIVVRYIVPLVINAAP